ncbi:arylamine N-acetyltransferase [Ktedonosporobacter rubrisoli]|uniref:Arylamine N-acetyltransferase n=1 Tax=Ktedonosporobacter rubrisoli TaxID=2509675 RepID=A0A4P6JLF8_KTERU|nr:arylamine N-acetyltransferase [Ktedonosporobacter rubrisoli]QBD75496.1 arylamine N-acetyltransferase [Ktedonosporobacter rubrisoli]
MSASPFRLDAYLERINYRGPLTRSAETLKGLHRAQMLSIPFENFDILLGKPIHIDADSLMRKLIDERRGGYCHELNGLFLLALQHLGFAVRPLAARVSAVDGWKRRSHQMAMVEIEGKPWIADVGFGGNCLIEAVPLDLDREFPQYLDTYRFKSDARLGFILQHKLAEQWHNLYAFSLEEFYAPDYMMMNYYNSTSPDSFFVQHIVGAIPTEEARIIIFDTELKIRRPDETTTIQLKDKTAYREALERYFGIVLPAGARLQSPYSEFSFQL